MAMTDSQRYEYDRYMSDGEWHMRKAADNLGYHYFSEAKNHYWKASQCFDKAYDIARSAGDYAQNEAARKKREADSEYSSVSYKEDDYVHSL